MGLCVRVDLGARTTDMGCWWFVIFISKWQLPSEVPASAVVRSFGQEIPISETNTPEIGYAGYLLKRAFYASKSKGTRRSSGNVCARK